MKRRILLCLIFSAVAVDFPLAQAQSLTYRIRKEDSHFAFSIYKWGVFKEEGRFRDFDGTVVFDPRNPSSTKVEIVINTSSVDSRNEGRDRALRSNDFFAVTQFPTMRFTSVSVSSRGDTLDVVGDMTIRGITKRITIPVRVAGVNRVGGELGTLAGFESEFIINREDFNVGKGWSIIDRDAHIHVLIGAGSQTTASK